MSWIWWTIVIVLGLNVLFFGVLCVCHLIERRRGRG